MSYQPPQNRDQQSPWSGGAADDGRDAVRDGGPQGPSYDAGRDEAPRYGVRTPEGSGQDQRGGVPQYGRYGGAGDSGQGQGSYGQPVGFGSSAPQQGAGQPQSYSPAGMNPNQDPYVQGGYQPRGKVKDGRGMGIASLVLGIVSIVLFWVLGIFIITALIGLILGIIALVRASRARAGKGFGIAGVILNGIGLLINGAMLVFSLILGASMFAMFSDPDMRACLDTYMDSELTTQDQADFEQCVDDTVDQQLDDPATAS